MVKSHPLMFTLGGLTSMPIRRQSATYSATLSVSFCETESRAVMYSIGIMAFQVAGLHGDDAVIGGVALVEAVAGELLPVVEDLAGGLLGDAALHCPMHELLLVLEQLVLDLLGDGFAQVVRLGRGIARQLHRRRHQLFLVHREAVGLLEDRLQQGVLILDRLLAVHAADVSRDEFHRARAEQRHHGDHVLDGVGLHLHQPAAHARAFHLEHTRRLAPPQQGIGGGVIGGDVIQGELHPVPVAGSARRRVP